MSILIISTARNPQVEKPQLTEQTLKKKKNAFKVG